LGGNLLLLKQNGHKKTFALLYEKAILLTAFVVITTMLWLKSNLLSVCVPALFHLL
jgi:hypothetical protein